MFEKISSNMNSFIVNQRYILVYPSLVFGGAVMRLLAGSERLESVRKSWYLLTEGNMVNYLFVINGNNVWLVLYILMAGVQCYIRTKESDSLPLGGSVPGSSSRERYTIFLCLVKQFIVKLALKMVLLDRIFWLIDHVFIWTGGRCTVSDTKSSMECYRLHGKWVGGFDISGHFCFVTNLSLILWCELFSLEQYLSANEIRLRKRLIWIKYMILLALVTWIFILWVTALFYHTLLEKVLGLILGYVCPVVMYAIIPYYPKLQRILY
ncbi:Yft2p Ecym_8183 [Eremothecium cymbalariae DBVPG|uniref:Acyl-coenzyme A diphosphatase YFT2 n=1 Tax=Eremothecium cymbalariae (strain CBS 270.75 / DBVPG 7215 / KCTC 17166 / NRRL Y-17582) TaxID=931890 RepID=G8JX95_ERECY|nr:Hypothetical protein Ecym_8183 [Eremothecium cymbalariae DBVPG\